jgi:hypothetical protein
MKKLLLVGAVLVAASSCADAGVRARWIWDCTPTYEGAEARSKTTKVRLALEFISPDGKDRWQMRQYHAYHLFDNGIELDYTYWLFDRTLTIIDPPPMQIYMWRGKVPDLAQPSNKTVHQEVFGELGQRKDGTYFYFEAQGDDPLTASDTLRSECVFVNETQEPDK